MSVDPALLHVARVALLALAGAPITGCADGSAAAQVAESPAFDAERAWGHLERLVEFGDRSVGRPGLERTRAYLHEQLTALGLAPQREEFTARTPLHAEVPFANVWADLPAAEGAPLVVLMTHFDTKSFEVPGAPRGEGFQGANDGGSGTAVLLELARVLASEREPRPVRYRLLFVDGEEATRWDWAGLDNTYGSRHHVERLRAAGELEDVEAVVLLDMVGDAKLRLERELNSSPELLELFFSAARRIGLGEHVDGPRRQIEDDHRSFLAHGIPSVDLIDFNYGPGNSYWHDGRDRLENCSRESLGVVGRIVLAGLPRLEEFALARQKR